MNIRLAIAPATALFVVLGGDALAQDADVGDSSASLPGRRADLTRLDRTRIEADSSREGFGTATIANGCRRGDGTPETSWASADAPRDHWLEMRWPAEQTVAAVKVYWCERRFRATSRRFHIETLDGGQWIRQGEVRQDERPLCNLARFAAVRTRGLRLLQPPGGGPQEQPNVLCVAELEAYGPGADTELVLDEDFTQHEFGKPPEGWTVEGRKDKEATFRVAERDVQAGDRCLETRGRGWPNIRASRRFTPAQSGVWAFDVSHSVGRVMAFLLDSIGRIGPYVTVETSGELRYRDASSPKSYRKRRVLERGQWYRVRVLWDVGVGAYDVWLDDALVQRGVPFMDEGITLPLEAVGFLNNTAGETSYRVDNVKVQNAPLAMPASPPHQAKITELADLCLTTVLAGEAGPECAVVVPDKPRFRELAEQIRLAVRRCCGVDLPVRIDTESLDVLDASSAIAIGCLANNKLIEKLYLDWFTLCDRWYPGAGGWLIRTIHNPYGTGRNVILLGAGEDAMLTKAVTAFCTRLRPGSPCQVGRIWDIHLGDGMELRPDVDSIGLSHAFNDKDQGLGLNKVFQHGLRYWYTGDEAYAGQFMRSIAANPDQIAAAGHYNAHKHPLIWDVIEESPSFTDEQRLVVANAFLRHLRSTESAAAPGIKSWLAAKNPKRMMERHGMAAALCALDEARYLQTHYPSQEFADALARVDRYFARQMTHGKGWKDEIDLHTYLEMPLHYAILRRNQAFRESGALRLFADRCVQYCSNQGGLESYPFYLLRMVGHLLGDPGYVYAADMRRRAEERFGPLTVHEFVGPQAFAGDLEPSPPQRHVGVVATPVDPIEHWVYDYRLPIEDGFDKLTLRAGFGVDDDYLLLDGVSRIDDKANYDAMEIKEFSSAGCVFLAPYTNCTVLERQGFVHHNLVTVTKDGQAELPPPVAERKHTAELGGIGYAHVRMGRYVHSAYDRRLIWRPNRWVVVCDRVEASETGDYALQCNWSMPAEGKEEDGCYRANAEGDHGARACWIKCAQRYPLRVTRSSIAFRLYAESSFPYFGQELTRLAQMACGKLRKGESREFTNLIYASGGGRPEELDVRAVEPGLAVLTGEENAFLVSADSLEHTDAELRLRADAAVLTDSQAVLFACRRFAWRDLQLQSTEPVDVVWSLADGRMEVDAAEATQVTLPGTARVVVDGQVISSPSAAKSVSITLSEGHHRLSGLVDSPSRERRLDITRAAHAAASSPAPPPKQPQAANALRALWEIAVPSTVTSLESVESTDGPLVLAGDSHGTVHGLRDGRTVWTFETGGKVECIAVGRLDGGRPAVLIGSDDEHLYRLGLDGREAWRLKMGGDYGCEWWTLGCRSPVQAILITDLLGDGSSQIVAGHGGMQLELVGAEGTSRWRQSWYYGIPATLAAVDADGDGVKEIMTGGWIRSCTSYVKSFSHDGKPLNGGLYGAGRTNRGFDCAGVPFLRYFRKADALRAVVARSGPYCDLGMYDHASQTQLWHRVVGDTVTGLELVDLDGDGAPEIVYSTRAGWVVAVDRSGQDLWVRRLANAVSGLELWGDDIAAGCEDGSVCSLDRRGNIAAAAQAEPGRIWLSATGSGRELAVASGDRVTLYSR